MTERLTAFQRDALAGIHDVLRATGHSPEAEELAGHQEKYLIVTVLGYRVLLYENGAEILGNGMDRRLEIDDFNSLHELRAHLITELRQLLA